MAKLFANNGDPDQTPGSAASDLGLHCLPITLLWVSRLQLVKERICSQRQIHLRGYLFLLVQTVHNWDNSNRMSSHVSQTNKEDDLRGNLLMSRFSSEKFMSYIVKCMSMNVSETIFFLSKQRGRI